MEENKIQSERNMIAMKFTNISFPGVGIEGFRLKNFIFSLGSLEINWSLFIFLAGVVAAFFYAAVFRRM